MVVSMCISLCWSRGSCSLVQSICLTMMILIVLVSLVAIHAQHLTSSTVVV